MKFLNKNRSTRKILNLIIVLFVIFIGALIFFKIKQDNDPERIREEWKKKSF